MSLSPSLCVARGRPGASAHSGWQGCCAQPPLTRKLTGTPSSLLCQYTYHFELYNCSYQPAAVGLLPVRRATLPTLHSTQAPLPPTSRLGPTRRARFSPAPAAPPPPAHPARHTPSVPHPAQGPTVGHWPSGLRWGPGRRWGPDPYSTACL